MCSKTRMSTSPGRSTTSAPTRASCSSKRFSVSFGAHPGLDRPSGHSFGRRRALADCFVLASPTVANRGEIRKSPLLQRSLALHLLTTRKLFGYGLSSWPCHFQSLGFTRALTIPCYNRSSGLYESPRPFYKLTLVLTLPQAHELSLHTVAVYRYIDLNSTRALATRQLLIHTQL